MDILYHLNIWNICLVFLEWILYHLNIWNICLIFLLRVFIKQKGEDGALKNARNERHREIPNHVSTSTQEVKNKKAFLYVLIPSAHTPSHCSSSSLAFEISHRICTHIHVLSMLKQSSKPQRKRKECLRTIGMGGIGKHQTEFSPPISRWKQSKLGFLHVPSPTALMPSFLPLSDSPSRSHIYPNMCRHVYDFSIKAIA